MNKARIVSYASGIALAGTLALAAVPAFAQTTPTTSTGQQMMGRFDGTMGENSRHGRGGMMGGAAFATRPVAVGKITAVSGTSITLEGRQGRPDESSNQAITYTIDASNAKVMKGATATTLSSLAVGNMIAVEGSLSGTTIAATTIHTGMMGRMGMMGGDRDAGRGNPQNAPEMKNIPAGNGQPVIAGKVTAVSGTSLTVTNSSNVTYTVDITNAKFTKGAVTASTSPVVVGDTVVVQGSISGTSVTASSVLDQATTASSASTPTGRGGVVGFFMHLFGF